MRFSICSWTFGSTPIEQVFAFVSAAGYACIDLTATVDDFDCDRVARLARDFSLEISGLTCANGWPAEDHVLVNKKTLFDRRSFRGREICPHGKGYCRRLEVGR